MSAIIHYSAMRKTVHQQLLLDIDTLEIHERACVALSGRNGAGKSTLMRIIAGLEAPDSVTVTFDGQTMPWRRAVQRMRTHVIYLHQNPYLFDRSVTDNIAYGLRHQKLAIKEISSKVAEALDWAGISHLQMRNARELSGGERQQVAFARARILRPRVLLLDEPMTNMDSEAREQTCRMIKRLKDDGVSILLATHEFHTVAHLCDIHLSLESGSLRPRSIDSTGGERKIIPCG
ncbi:MAG: energy-coupling factor ABC transporter ATP-binding protein [Gammaproteobacteria bacterium]|nr:energy-coupling factor ABC transporter ATP-binding protein [Gammaproteobacteria bacterium]